MKNLLLKPLLFTAFFTFTLFSLPVTGKNGPAAGVVKDLQNNSVTISVNAKSIFNIGEKLFILREGSVGAELIVTDVFHSYIKAEIISGFVKIRDAVYNSNTRAIQSFLTDEELLSLYEFIHRSDTIHTLTNYIHDFLSSISIQFKPDFSSYELFRNSFGRIFTEASVQYPSEIQVIKKFFQLLTGYLVNNVKVTEECIVVYQSIQNPVLKGETAYLLSLMLLRSGNYGEARSYLEKANGIFLNHDAKIPLRWHILSAKIYLYQGQYSIVVKLLNPLVELYSGSLFINEILLTKYQAEIQQDDKKAALATLEKLLYFSESETYVISALCDEYRLLRSLDKHEMADVTFFNIRENFPDSPYLFELVFSDINKNLKSVGIETALLFYKDVFVTIPNSPTGEKSFLNLINLLARLHMVQEIHELINLYSTIHPGKTWIDYTGVCRELLNNLTKVGEKSAPMSGHKLIPFDIEKDSKADLVLCADDSYRQMLSSSLENYQVTGVYAYGELSVLNQTITMIRYYLEKMLAEYLEHSHNHRFSEEILAHTIELYCDLDNIFLKENKKELSRPEQLIRDINIPKQVREAYYYSKFKYFRKSEPETASHHALECLKYNTQPVYLADLFQFFENYFSMAYDYKKLEQLLSQIQRLYAYDNSYTGKLTVVLQNKFPAPLHPAVKNTTNFPAHARVFSKSNNYEGFDLFKDFSEENYFDEFKALRVNGAKPRIESRMLALRGDEYNSIRIGYYVPELEKLKIKGGSITWINWDEHEWNLTRKKEFSFHPENTGEIYISLNDGSWGNIVKRIRIDFNIPESKEVFIKYIAVQ